MAISSIRTSHVLAGLLELEQKFGEIGQMRSDEQVTAVQGLQANADLLTKLQQHMAYDFETLKARMPDLTTGDLDTIRLKLRELAAVRELINVNVDIAIAAKEISEIISQSPSLAPSLMGRVTQLLSEPKINNGNKETLLVTQRSIEMQNRLSSQRPPAPQFSTAPSYPASLQQGGGLEDENQRVSMFESRCAYISDNFHRASYAETFSAIEGVYRQALNFHQQHNNSYCSSTNKTKVENILEAAFQNMRQMIQYQRNDEGSKSEKAEEPRSGHASTSPLHALKIALEGAAAAAETLSPSNDVMFGNIKRAFAALREQEQRQLFEALSTVLLEARKIQRPLNPALLNMKPLDLFMWGGNYEHRIQAVERLLAASTPPASSSAHKSVADDMERRLNTLMGHNDNTPQDLLNFGDLSASNNSTRYAEQPAAPQQWTPTSSGSVNLSDDVMQLLGMSQSPQRQTTIPSRNNDASRGGPWNAYNVPSVVSRQQAMPTELPQASPVEPLKGIQDLLPILLGKTTYPETSRALLRAMILYGLESLETAAKTKNFEDVFGICEYLQSIGLDSRDVIRGKTVADTVSDVIHGSDDIESAVPGIEKIRLDLAKLWDL